MKKELLRRMLTVLAVILISMVMTIVITYFLILPQYKKNIMRDVLHGDITLEEEPIVEKSVEVNNTHTEAGIEEKIADYISKYFSKTNLQAYLSEKNIAAISNMMITSLQEGGFMDGNAEQVRTTIITELEQIMAENNITHEEKVEITKSNLQQQITDNRILSETEKKKILDLISSLNKDSSADMEALKAQILKALETQKSFSAEELEKIKQELEKIVTGNEAALTDFKTYLDSEVIPGLSTVISNNSEEIKNHSTSINNNSEEIKNHSTSINNNSEEIKNHSTSINNNSTEIKNNSTSIQGLANDMYNAKTDITNINNSITALFGKMNNCTITYNEGDGHFYITYNAGGADSVSKKLDFAP